MVTSCLYSLVRAAREPKGAIRCTRSRFQSLKPHVSPFWNGCVRPESPSSLRSMGCLLRRYSQPLQLPHRLPVRLVLWRAPPMKLRICSRQCMKRTGTPFDDGLSAGYAYLVLVSHRFCSLARGSPTGTRPRKRLLLALAHLRLGTRHVSRPWPHPSRHPPTSMGGTGPDAVPTQGGASEPGGRPDKSRNYVVPSRPCRLLPGCDDPGLRSDPDDRRWSPDAGSVVAHPLAVSRSRATSMGLLVG